MKHLIYLFAGITVSLSGQSVFDFENDSLTGWIQIPENRWEQTGVLPIHGTGSLHHAYDNPASGVDQIVRLVQYPDLSDTLSVAFRIRHGYPPSSGNNWQLFLLATDHTGIEEAGDFSSAVIFGVNYSGYDDHLKLWHLLEGNVIESLDTGLDYQEYIGSAAAPLFKVSRYPDGRWQVLWHLTGETDSLTTVGVGIEIEEPRGKYMGFRYSYSSSQDRKLWVDDILVDGRFYRDTLPPEITGFRLLELNGVEVSFSETVSGDSKSTCTWNGMMPDSLVQSLRMHRYFFRENFPNRINQQLNLSGIRDPEGNVMSDTVISFRQDLAAFGDIVINELMTDPVPVIYLPDCEYVELFNRYSMPLDLGGWHLRVNKREYDIQPATIPPGGFVLLTHSDCNGRYGDIIQQSVLTSASALFNGGAVISLEDQYGRLIHRLEYEEMGHYGEQKNEGGWSLERIDPDNLCGGIENWLISMNGKGGTPGEVNSHQADVPDYDPPIMIGLGMPADSLINIFFDEPILLRPWDQTQILMDDHLLVHEKGVSDLVAADLLVFLEYPMEVPDEHDLTLKNISDCSGNVAGDQVIQMRLPSFPGQGLPVLNEIMYDPAPGGNEYVELYNKSEKYFDLHDMQLEIRDFGSVTGTVLPVSEQSRLLFPGSYVVLCSRPYALIDEWNIAEKAAVIGLDEWKLLPNEGACIRLTDRSGKIIDQVCYHDSLHHDLLRITSGAALERIAADCGPGAQCWTSAAASENYGTPGIENSQSMDIPEQRQQFHLFPKVFSPDGDGVDDVLCICPGNMVMGGLVDLYITDLAGQLVQQIVSMGIAGTNDLYFWNGKDLAGKIVTPGIYIIHLRSSGGVAGKTQRLSCAVIYR